MQDSEKYQEAVYPGFEDYAKHINSSRVASLVIYRRADLSVLEKTLHVMVSCMDTTSHNELVLAEKRKKKDFHISPCKIAQCLCYKWAMAYITMK